MIHELKTWPEFFEDVWKGEKLFEVRKDDRLFDVGDTLELLEYDPYEKTFSGRKIFATITYKLNGGKFGIEIGFCILGFKIKDKWEYYYLKEGEIIQEGDEVEMSNSIHDPAKWETAKKCHRGKSTRPGLRFTQEISPFSFCSRITSASTTVRPFREHGS